MNKIEPIPWRGVRALEKLIIVVLPILAIAILALNFLDEALLRRLSRLLGTGSALGWLANGYNSLLISVGLLLLLVIFVFLVRSRLMGNEQLWTDTGCPNCKERELVRVKRQFGDRFYRLLGVPAYRYACRNCTWRGLRVAYKEFSLEREMEKEEAMRRFQPDGLPYLEEARHETAAELSEPSVLDEFQPATPLPTQRYTIIEILDKPRRVRRRAQ